MVASFETEGGAALIAFWIFHPLLLTAGVGVCAATPATRISSAQPLSDERIPTCLMGDLLLLVLQNRVQAERHLADVLEGLVRRERLHERAGPHVAIEARQRAPGEIPGAARGAKSTIDDCDRVTRHRQLGALEALHELLQLVHLNPPLAAARTETALRALPPA